MAITSGFFDSLNGDRRYNAEQMSNYFDGLISNGVYENIGEKLVVTPGTGMSVIVGTGRAIINCHWLKNDAQLNLALDPSDAQYPRYDAVVLRLDMTESGRNIDITIKTGVPQSLPVVPSLTRTQDVYELMLAAVRVDKNVTSITQAHIFDRRSSNQCGWITGLIKQVDTSDLFLQWQDAYETYYEQATSDFNDYMLAKKAEFNAWFNSLTQTLNVDTGLVKYQNTVHAVGAITAAFIGIPEYDAENDILFTYIGGVLFVENNEYTIVGTGASAYIALNKPITGENDITFIVLKNAIGKSVMMAGISALGTNGAAANATAGTATSGE